MSEDPKIMEKLDANTVKEVELTAPGFSERDRNNLHTKMKDGLIFQDFDNQEREAIWERLLLVSKDRLIPSLRSFFEDWKYLERPARLMRELMGRPSDRSILAGFRLYALALSRSRHERALMRSAH